MKSRRVRFRITVIAGGLALAAAPPISPPTPRPPPPSPTPTPVHDRAATATRRPEAPVCADCHEARSRPSPRIPTPATRSKDTKPDPRTCAPPATATAPSTSEAGGDKASSGRSRASRARRTASPATSKLPRTPTTPSRPAFTPTRRRSTASRATRSTPGSEERAPPRQGPGRALRDLPLDADRLLPEQALRAPARPRRHDLPRLPRPARRRASPSR